MSELARWLERLGLQQYAELFAVHGVDMEVLPNLTDRDLRDLGLPLGPRRTILRTIEKRPTIAALNASAPTRTTRPAERRQLTVMFCDLANSTALSGLLDPEDLREVLGAYQEACSVAIRLYQGHIARCIGDGILAYFGYPIAHEDEADRAVRAGLGVVEAMARLKMSIAREKNVELAVRVGIATGFVVVGDIVGEGVLDQDAVVGKAPNLAARLQGVAEPNTVIVSSQTKQLAGSFSYIGLGERTFKGISEPTMVWQVVGERVVSRLEAREAALSAFVNRYEEIDLLLKYWRCAKSGEGRVVAISGEPGIGKSRLAAEATEQILATERELGGPPPSVLCLQCSRYHSNTALFPVIRQLGQAASIDPHEPDGSKFTKLENSLKHWGIKDAQTLSILADLCNIELVERLRPQISPREKRHQTIEALKGWCASLATNRPLLIIFEDIQWIDPTSKLLLNQLMDWAKAARVLIIATARGERLAKTSRLMPALAEGSPHVALRELSELTDAQTMQLISAVAAGRRVPQRVMEAIQEKSGCVPLFAEELTIGFLEADTLQEGDAPGLSSIPNTIYDALMARLDQMGKAREVAQQASVIGREFSVGLLSKIVGTLTDELALALDNLERYDVITPSASVPGVYVFRHTLIRDIAYQSLLKRSRREIHLMIATELALSGADYPESTDDLIAQHYSYGEARAEAIAWWQRAARGAIARSAHEEAANMLRRAFHDFRALGSARSPALELDLTLGLATALRSLQGYASPEVEEMLLRARELCAQCESGDERFSVEWELFQCNLVKGNIAGAQQIAGDLFEYAQKHPGRPHVDAYLAEGMAKFHFGDFERASSFFGQGIALSNPEIDEPHHFTHGQNPGCFCSSYLAHTQCFLGHPDEARATMERNLDIARRRATAPSHLYTYVNVLTFAIRVHQFLGDALKVKLLADELVSICRLNHYEYYEALATVHLGWAIGSTGAVPPGIEKMQEGLAGLEKTGTMLALPGFYLSLSEFYIRNGNLDEASRALAKAAGKEGWGTRMWDAEVERMRGVILASGLGDDLRASEGAYRFSLEIARRQGARTLELRTAVSYGLLLERLGRAQEGGELLKRCLEHFNKAQAFKDVQEAQAILKRSGMDGRLPV